MPRRPTPLRKLPRVAGYSAVYIKDESANPTGTFKDRLVERAVECAPPGAVIATISYGNTALSMAHHLPRWSSWGARTLLGCVLVPEDLCSWVLGPSTSGRFLRGSDLRRHLEQHLTVIDLPISAARLSPIDVEALVRRRLPDVEAVKDITEGLERPCYTDIVAEAVTQLGGPPDVCLVPFGAGILCNEVMDYLSSHGCQVVPLSVSRRDSMARMLFGPMWVDVESLEAEGVAMSAHRSPDATGAVRTPYRVYCVREPEVELGLVRAMHLGISAEPSGSVGLGVLDRLAEIAPAVTPDSVILVLNTGNAIDRFPSISETSR